MDTLVIALRVALSLAVVVGLLWFMQRKVTRSSRVSKNAQLIHVVGRQGVGQKASVVVVDIDGQRFVLGVTEQNVNVLQSADAPAPVAVAAPTKAASTRSSADLFALTLDSATSEEAAATAAAGSDALADAVLHGPAVPHSATKRALGGSILSPATWKQTAAALRQHP